MHQPVVGHGHQDGAEEEVDGSALCLMCGFFHQSGKQMVLFIYVCSINSFFLSFQSFRVDVLLTTLLITFLCCCADSRSASTHQSNSLCN